MITKDVLEKLEFNKVITHIEKYCSTDNGKSAIQNMLPFESVNEIKKIGEQVNEAKEILINQPK